MVVKYLTKSALFLCVGDIQYSERLKRKESVEYRYYRIYSENIIFGGYNKWQMN